MITGNGQLLFFYGVLQPDLAEGAVAALVAGLGPGTAAVTTGHLYAVLERGGWHPAMVPDTAAGLVHGQLFDGTGVDIAALDAFELEGIDYDRRAIAVRPQGGHWRSAEAYCWRRPVDGLELIGHGNFARWLAETGNPVLRG